MIGWSAVEKKWMTPTESQIIRMQLPAKVLTDIYLWVDLIDKTKVIEKLLSFGFSLDFDRISLQMSFVPSKSGQFGKTTFHQKYWNNFNINNDFYLMKYWGFDSMEYLVPLLNANLFLQLSKESKQIILEPGNGDKFLQISNQDCNILNCQSVHLNNFV